MPGLLSAVQLTDVSIDRGDTPIIDSLSLTFPEGAVTALIGDNGAGKSTLLEAIAGVLAHRGEMTGLPPSRALVVQRTHAGDHLPLTCRRAVAMGRWRERGFFGRLTQSDRQIVDDSLAALGLTDLADRPLASLSGGQRQRALVAQGLAARADLLLLDEPTASADSLSRGRIDNALRTAAGRGTTVIVSTHDRTSLARADYAVLLERGRVITCGAPARVAEMHADRVRAALLPEP